VQNTLKRTIHFRWEEEFIATFLSHFLILVGAMLLAGQIRLQVPLGYDLLPSYQPDPPFVFLLLIFAALLVSMLVVSPLAHQPPYDRFLTKHHSFRRYLISLGLSAVSIVLLLPDISKFQLLYFVVVGFILGSLCIALPYRLYVGHPGNSVFTSLRALWQRRALFSIWLRFNIQTRYSQRVLGILWIVLLPVAMSVVLSIAFTQFMRVQLDVPYITFYMAAVIPYTLFSNSVINSTGSVIGRIGIIAQVYFPREILVLLTLGESVVDFAFAFLAMLVINALNGVLPNPNFIYLPLLFLVLAGIALGLMFLVGSLTVIVRDIPQLLAVLMQLLFFLTPIIYPLEQFPERLRFLFVINPIAPLIQGFRDVIVYGRAPEMSSLYYSIVFMGVALVVGYSTFKSIESEMADYV
jgi:ABC-type polysaccharide/polyol phosphate export permease